MNDVRWPGQGVCGLQAIRRYTERDSPRYGRFVGELGGEDVREIIIGEYRIVYRRELDAVMLLSIFRSSHLFPAILPGFECVPERLSNRALHLTGRRAARRRTAVC